MTLLGKKTLWAAIERDNAREDAGMHPDERETCFRCSGWATDGHAHDPVTGTWMSAEEWQKTWARLMQGGERER